MYKYLLIIEHKLADRIKAKASHDRRTFIATIILMLEKALKEEGY